MIFGGVFERFPGLRVLLSEATAGWVIAELKLMDQIFSGKPTTTMKAEIGRVGIDLSDQRGDLTRPPSEYFLEHCFVNAAASTNDWALRRAEGYDISNNMLWGNDYPHPEGTWPTSVEQLRATITELDVPAADVAKILGGNAARVYGFDLDALRPTADRVGPDFGID